MEPLYVIIGLIIFLCLWFVFMYNRLIKLRNHCGESWSDIDTELKRRYNLIPNLIETVKGYAKHEQETLNKVVEARNKAMASTGSPSSQAADENIFAGALKSLFALSESYPDLKANTNFKELQTELTNTEDRIQSARRFYNANVRDLNTAIEVFPSNVIAGMFAFRKAEFFELDEPEARKVPQVRF